MPQPQILEMMTQTWVFMSVCSIISKFGAGVCVMILKYLRKTKIDVYNTMMKIKTNMAACNVFLTNSDKPSVPVWAWDMPFQVSCIYDDFFWWGAKKLWFPKISVCADQAFECITLYCSLCPNSPLMPTDTVYTEVLKYVIFFPLYLSLMAS